MLGTLFRKSETFSMIIEGFWYVKNGFVAKLMILLAML